MNAFHVNKGLGAKTARCRYLEVRRIDQPQGIQESKQESQQCVIGSYIVCWLVFDQIHPGTAYVQTQEY